MGVDHIGRGGSGPRSSRAKSGDRGIYGSGGPETLGIDGYLSPQDMLVGRTVMIMKRPMTVCGWDETSLAWWENVTGEYAVVLFVGCRRGIRAGKGAWNARQELEPVVDVPLGKPSCFGSTDTCGDSKEAGSFCCVLCHPRRNANKREVFCLLLGSMWRGRSLS